MSVIRAIRSLKKIQMTSTPARRPPLPSETSRFSRPPIKCFRCGGAHHIRHCPESPNNNNNNNSHNNNNNNYRNKSSSHPAWRYVEPKDLTKPVIDETGNVWKFCTKCVCNKTGRTGLYLKSHYDHEHNSSHETFTHESRKSSNLPGDYPKNSANLAVPCGTHAQGSIPKLASYEDPLKFHGAWCASVSTAASFEDPPALPVLSSSSSPSNTTAPSTVDCYVFFLFPSHIFELKISCNPRLCAPHSIEQSRLMLPINYETYMLFYIGGEARMMKGR